MLTEPQQQFLDNLLSGEFVQGTGALRRNDNTWCCLGVACETYRRATGEGEWNLWNSSEISYEFILDGKHEDSVMPWEVARWLGLESQNPYINEYNTAAEYNDGTALFGGKEVKWNFEEIAEGFKKLFEERNENDE